MTTDEALGDSRRAASIAAFALFGVVSIVHVILTNLEGNLFDISKVLLMPTLAVALWFSARNSKAALPIFWALTGLWLGNVCLIWGEESKVLFILGSAFTIIGFLGYMWILIEPVESLPKGFILWQLPILWTCAAFVFVMHEALGEMFVPMALYITLIAVIALCALARLLSFPGSSSSWLYFAASLFYIAENGLYAMDHYMHFASWGENVVHPCFIAAQTLFVVGFLRSESGH